MKNNIVLIGGVVVLVCIVIIGYVFMKGDELDIRTPDVATEQELIATVFYECDGEKTIAANYFEDGSVEHEPAEMGEMPVPTGSVQLTLSDGRELDLPQTISASGIRYANDDESFVFWSKGNTAFVVEGEEETFSNCAEESDAQQADE